MAVINKQFSCCQHITDTLTKLLNKLASTGSFIDLVSQLAERNTVWQQNVLAKCDR